MFVRKGALLIGLAIGLIVTPSQMAFADIPAQIASENNERMSDEIKAKALSVFPEYTDDILGKNLKEIQISPLNAESSNSVVVSESRAVSDSEVIHFTKYSNGVSFMALLVTPGKNVYNTVQGNTYFIYQMNAWLTCANSSDVLFVNSVHSRVNNNGTNSMASYGYVDQSLTSANSPMRIGTKQNGNSTSPAYVEYQAYFTVLISTGGEPIEIEQSGILRILGNGGVSAD